MRKNIFLLVLMLFCSCRLMTSYTSYIDTNNYGRMQLKKMEFKDSFKPDMANKIDCEVLYYSYNVDYGINSEFHFLIRFFKNGQYAFFSKRIGTITQSNYELIDYNDYKKATYVGYYNVKNDNIIVEYPNTLFRRSGKRNLDKYIKISNADLKSITNLASDYKSNYNKIKVNDLLPINPDW